MGSFLDDYMEYTKPLESPDMFHMWVGLSIISIALGRRVRLSQGFYSIYPNTYTVLVSKSSLARKSRAMEQGVELLEASGVLTSVTYLKDELTKQAIIDEVCVDQAGDALMAKIDGKVSDEPAVSRPVFLHADEFGSLLSKQAIQDGIPTMLNAVYTGKPTYEYKTKTQGKYIINKPCFTILAGTIPEWFLTQVQITELQQGLLSRVYWVYQPTRRHRNALPKMTEEHKILRQSLIVRLAGISTLEGVMTLSPEAIEIYVEWYNAVEPPPDSRLDVFYGRLGDHVLKIAMLHAIAWERFPIVQKQDVRAAIAILDQLMLWMPRMFVGVQMTPTGGMNDLVLSKISDHPGGILRAHLLRDLLGHLNANDLDIVINTLAEAGQIAVKMDGGVSGRGIVYKRLEQPGRGEPR